MATDDVQVQPTEALTTADRAAVIEVCVAALESELFHELFDQIPSGGRHVLGYRDGALVSHAVVTTRWVQPSGERELKTAFVDAVSTHPDCQRLGYGTAVMRRLADEIDDYEIGCLQTDDAIDFYARLGWELWRGPLAGRGVDRLIPTPDQRGVMVLRLPNGPSLDLDAPLSIEAQPYRIWD